MRSIFKPSRPAAALVAASGIILGFFGFLALAPAPSGQDSLAMGLIGASVYAAEGAEVGAVTAVTVGADGQITEVGVTAALPLGLGTRTVAIGRGSFTLTGAGVLLDLTADEVAGLPDPMRPHTAALAI